MKTVNFICMYLVVALSFFQCQEPDLVAPQQGSVLETSELPQAEAQYQTGNTYHVATTGNDSGDGSSASPWRTLRYAVTRVAAGLGHTIKLGAGTFVESGLVEVPLGVNIEGSGKDVTIIKAVSAFHHYPADPGYATDKFIISLNGYNAANGNQILKNFTIDGDGKKLHGGIWVKYRNNVSLEGVKVQNTNFTGIWLWDVKDVLVKDVHLINCSWGSNGYSVGALNLGNLERVEIVNLDVNESTGYGIKAIGPGGYNNLVQLKIHDSRVSVNPVGLWNGGSAPNIAIELWQVSMVGCEIYNTYVDNTISLVNSHSPAATGVQSIRVHDNIIDMETRSNGAGYGVELSVHDAEIDHNYFIKGTQGIANWDNPFSNWNIHHNVFYGIQGIYPGEIVRSQWSGLHNVKLYNNTIEFVGDKTSNVVGVYGGTSSNVDIKNNLIINSNTSYNWYPNQLIHTENGATINNLQVTSNLLQNLPIGGLLGSILSNLTSSDPKITKTGVRPQPYYIPTTGSPLIDGGANVGFQFQGSAPDIGAFETGGVTNTVPTVSLTSPANNSSVATGTAVSIAATANDSDGTITKVEFFDGATKLGEDTSSPYGYSWTGAAAGSHTLTAKATDNSGGASTSAPAAVTVSTTNVVPAVAISSPANNATFTSGASVTINATATDSDGTITKVEFFDGATKLGEDASSPYSYSWAGAGVGSHPLTAKATDNAGGAKVSAAVTVTVVGANLPPTVSISSPSNNAAFTAGASVTINATATDSDGSISKVEFFSGSTRLGEDVSSPYNYTWGSIQAGSYAITAKAIDNQAGTRISAAVTIVVTASTSSGQIDLDAAQASLSGKMAIGSEAAAPTYFSVPAGNGDNYYIPPSSNAAYTFQAPTSGNYVMWVRVKSNNGSNRGYYIYDGRGRWTTWQAGIRPQWTWVKVTDAYTGAVVSFSLQQGSNSIQFGWLNDNVQVDRIILTNNPSYVPQ